MVKVSFLADAMTMPLHWLYNQEELASLVGASSPIFFRQPSCPYYAYPLGALCPYGDESLPLMHAMAGTATAAKGDDHFDREAVATAYHSFFAAYPSAGANGHAYAGRLNHVPKSFVEKRGAGKPLEECRTADSTGHGVTKVPLLVARYAGGGSGELAARVRESVEVLQESELSVKCALVLAAVLESMLLLPPGSGSGSGSGVEAALAAAKTQLEIVASSSPAAGWGANLLRFVQTDELIVSWLKAVDLMALIAATTPEDALACRRVQPALLLRTIEKNSLGAALDAASFPPEDQPFVDRLNEMRAEAGGGRCGRGIPVMPPTAQVLKAFGLACGLPGMLLGALYVARKYPDFEEAISMNILAGGDNCARAMVIGALFGVEDRFIAKDEWFEIADAATFTDITNSVERITSANRFFNI